MQPLLDTPAARDGHLNEAGETGRLKPWSSANSLFPETASMDNVTMARLLSETADLMEIDGADSFRVRSYRNAADAIQQTTVDLVAASADTAQLLAISGIGKSMAANIQAIVSTGSLPLRDELLAKYGAGLLELLKLPGMGPKTVALLWDAARIGSIDQLADAIDAGRLKGLPRMGEKQIEKIRKGIEDYRRSPPAASASTKPKKPPTASPPTCWPSTASNASLPPVRCAAAGKPPATWTCWSRALPAPRNTPEPLSNTSPLIPASTT